MDLRPDDRGGHHRLREAFGSALEEGIRRHVPKAFGTLSRGTAWVFVFVSFSLAWKLSPGDSVPHISLPIPVLSRRDSGASPAMTRAVFTTRDFERLPGVAGPITVTTVSVVCPLGKERRSTFACVYELRQFVALARIPDFGLTPPLHLVPG